MADFAGRLCRWGVEGVGGEGEDDDHSLVCWTEGLSRCIPGTPTIVLLGGVATEPKGLLERMSLFENLQTAGCCTRAVRNEHVSKRVTARANGIHTCQSLAVKLLQRPQSIFLVTPVYVYIQRLLLLAYIHVTCSSTLRRNVCLYTIFLHNA